MAEYIPTDRQREAYDTDHSGRETFRSVVRLISTGKGIDRALVRSYVAHDVDTTGTHDTVGIYSLDVFAGGKEIRGYGAFAFNVIDGIPFAADFREFHPVMKAV